MEPILVPIKTAAEMCGVSRSKFYEWHKEGLIGFVKVGGLGHPLFRVADLKALARDAEPA